MSYLKNKDAVRRFLSNGFHTYMSDDCIKALLLHPLITPEIIDLIYDAFLEKSPYKYFVYVENMRLIGIV